MRKRYEVELEYFKARNINYLPYITNAKFEEDIGQNGYFLDEFDVNCLRGEMKPDEFIIFILNRDSIFRGRYMKVYSSLGTIKNGIECSVNSENDLLGFDEKLLLLL